MSTLLSNFSFICKLIIDILVVWLLLYSVLRLVRNNYRTIQIIKGALIILLIKGISMIFGLTAIGYIIDIFLNWGVVLILIIFQPEIRAILEKVGTTSATITSDLSLVEREKMIDDLVQVCADMSKSKTGALITIQQKQSLADYVRTGIHMDSEVSCELIGTIFQYGTPMHDGAVIIQGNRVACAAAYFPPTTNDLPSKYGARHRAAVGISEITDSITIIVSEETGNISVAYNGKLTQYKPEELKNYLKRMMIPDDTEKSTSILQPVINTAKTLSRSQKKSSNDERITPIMVVDNVTKGGK